MSSPEYLPSLEASSRSVSPMYSINTLESIRECLNFALEAEDSSSLKVSQNMTNKTSNNNHSTKCGYTRQEGDFSWQIRYKPFGRIQAGVLAGGDDFSGLARVLTSVAVAHFDSNDSKMIPKALVLFSLKCAELRYLLERGQTDLRKEDGAVVQIPTMSRLNGGTIVDIGPLFLPLLKSTTPSDVIQLIDMAISCSYPDQFAVVVSGEWKIRSHKHEADSIRYSSDPMLFAAVADVIRECLQPNLYAYATRNIEDDETCTPYLTQRSSLNMQLLNSVDNASLNDQISPEAYPLIPIHSQHDNKEAETPLKTQKRELEKRALQEPRLTPNIRPKRQRKSVSPFDATPWTIQQKKQIIKEKRLYTAKTPTVVASQLSPATHQATADRGQHTNSKTDDQHGPTLPGSNASNVRESQMKTQAIPQPIRSSSRIRHNTLIAAKVESAEDQRLRPTLNQPTHSKLQAQKVKIELQAAVAVSRKVVDSNYKVEEDEGRSDVYRGNHWQILDYRGIVSDYKYHDFDPLEFGNTIETAMKAVDMHLAEIQEKSINTIDDDMVTAEARMYARSMQERRQKADSERIEKERNRVDYEMRLMEYQYYTVKKRSADDLELEAFSGRPVHFASRETPRNLVCPHGPKCGLCGDVDTTTGALIDANKMPIILSPFIRPSDVRDRWRESNAGAETELIGRGKNAVSHPRRTGRNSNKRQHIFYMLTEMKHSLHFIQKYNLGYFEQDE